MLEKDFGVLVDWVRCVNLLAEPNTSALGKSSLMGLRSGTPLRISHNGRSEHY